jgi:hypothetical protein
MLNEDYKEMLQNLLEEDASFVVVGAHAMAAHGFPRATGDLDVWVDPSSENCHRVFRSLARFGAPLAGVQERDFTLPETIYQIGVAPRRIDIITSIDGADFEEARPEAIVIDLEGLPIPVLSLDHLIKNKESTGREKDALDAKTLRGKLKRA